MHLSIGDRGHAPYTRCAVRRQGKGRSSSPRRRPAPCWACSLSTRRAAVAGSSRRVLPPGFGHGCRLARGPGRDRRLEHSSRRRAKQRRFLPRRLRSNGVRMGAAAVAVQRSGRHGVQRRGFERVGEMSGAERGLPRSPADPAGRRKCASLARVSLSRVAAHSPRRCAADRPGTTAAPGAAHCAFRPRRSGAKRARSGRATCRGRSSHLRASTFRGSSKIPD